MTPDELAALAQRISDSPADELQALIGEALIGRPDDEDRPDPCAVRCFDRVRPRELWRYVGRRYRGVRGGAS